ncbi:MAG: hypothetical protein V3V01_17955 [Acidimicrobiales bacterium]
MKLPPGALLSVAFATALALSGCSVAEGDPGLQITSVSGFDEPLAVLDNCPPVRSVSLIEDELILWSVERSGPAPNSALVEIRLGGGPNGWTVRQPLEQGLSVSSKYLLRTQPGDHELKFELDDLVVGKGLSERGVGTLERADVANPCADKVNFDDLWQQGAVLFLVGLLVLAFVATVLVKLLQLLLDSRT